MTEPTLAHHAPALIAFCEAEIARRRKGRSVLDRTQDAFCHALTDVIYAAMEGDWAEVQALCDELDYLPLYRVFEGRADALSVAA